MKPQHTPGPWNNKTVVVAGTSLHDITSGFSICAGNNSICELLFDQGWSDEEVRANAALIATVPELLKMLEVAVEIIQNEYPADQWIDYRVPEMLNTIAKAKGVV